MARLRHTGTGVKGWCGARGTVIDWKRKAGPRKCRSVEFVLSEVADEIETIYVI